MNKPLRLKESRKAVGLTQQQVAEKLGISQNNYSYWENGKVKIDDVSLLRLAELFGVTVDYLLGRDEIEKTLDISEMLQKIIKAEQQFYAIKILLQSLEKERNIK